MSNSEEEKRQLEHQAAKLFMRAYEKETGHKIRHLWHNRPRKPDVSCLLEGSKLDIEVAHLYGSEAEAMAILGRHLNADTRRELIEQALEQNTDQRLVNALNRILAQKAGKSYRSQRVWLLIRNAHPAWNARKIQQFINKIQIPERHPFEQIWILGDMHGTSGIQRLA
ncbi:hypothetical protein [Oceanobacter mangrovi]|uniref:hypothetical protein n=1 Tax=Oceanobacter mangrovi TaxID=2862510 RepID=UPI001C8EA632|nr:hypothetical protein [Oceanobacter mangrovi]